MSPDFAFTGFAIDHRRVAPGDVFGAFAGAKVDGESFIAAAVAKGAVAVVARPEAQVLGAEHIADAEPRRAFAQMAAQFYQPVPSVMVAVTGTNGKTSVVEMLRQLWAFAGHKAASIGTLGIISGETTLPTGLTSPDIVTFLSNLAGLAKQGVTHAAYEASSHGLAQYRCEGPRVMAGAFTNLSRDHLDYHGTMEDYFAAKLRLFDQVVAEDGTAVVWADDAWSAKVCDAARQRGLRLITVGEAGETIRLLHRQPTALGQTLTIRLSGQQHSINLPLIGAYQAANALVAAGLAMVSGGDEREVLAGLERLQPVRGRLELAVMTPSGAPVYIDYAHTPDGLAAAIAALRPHTIGRLITVMGAGGDRDSGKRPLMGRIASEQADIVIVTDDNPRGEDPARIRSAVLAGASVAKNGATTISEIADRRAAIAAAISAAGTGDVVLIAGKGHEQGQIIGAGEAMRVLPFDDSLVARECAGDLAT